MFYTLLHNAPALPSSIQSSEILSLDVADFEHFTTQYAQDRLQQLPN